MSNLKLKVGCYQYDRVRALFDSTVKFDGVDTFLRYHFEQGLSKRRLTCADIFVPDLLTT